MNREKRIPTDKNLADKMYEPSDYKAKDELSRGLAVTHEQVSDVYMEGTMDAIIENVQGTGEDGKIPKEGYHQE